jgi:hypothetical protein
VYGADRRGRARSCLRNPSTNEDTETPGTENNGVDLGEEVDDLGEELDEGTDELGEGLDEGTDELGEELDGEG